MSNPTRTRLLAIAALVVGLLLVGCQGTAYRTDPTSSGTGTAADVDGDGVADSRADSGRFAEAPSLGELGLRVESIGSSTVGLSWDAVDGADGYDVYVGAEPPTGDDGVLADAVRVGATAAGETSFTVDGLAAGTDVFVRVENVGGDEAVFGVTHARVEGGPSATLATALQSVHGFGRDVLLLVVEANGARYDRSTGRLTGDHGAAWQGGTWTVERADGSAVGVAQVHRVSSPAGQPDYPVGFEVFGDDDVVDVEHRLFVVLDEAIGTRDVLRIRHEGDGATALEVLVPFSDRYLETPLVQLNQVGYSPRATKRWAYVAGWMGSAGGARLDGIDSAEVVAEPVDTLAGRRVVASDLPVNVRSRSDAESGGEVRDVDLSSVPAAEGVRYRVRIPGVGVSWPTSISEEAVMRTFYTAARGLYLNRWCGDLGADHTEWSRPADHCNAFFVTGHSYRDTMFPQSTPQTDERPVRGGHHDAGDFDIRPYHVLAGQYLLRAFEMDPSRFADGQLTIPESGNGIPDLLDEGLWSLQAWLDLQNADGSVRAGVESYRHPAGVYKADADELPYWTWDPEPWHTAYVAALFAQGARLVKPYDAARSRALDSAARSAYGSSVAGRAPAAYRMYAASELLALTGEASFARDFEARWAELDDWGRGAFDHMQSMTAVYPGTFDMGFAMADFVMGYAQSAAADPAVVAIIESQMVARADEAADAILDSPHAHRLGRKPGDTPDWGHTNSTGRHADAIYQALELGGLPAAKRQRYFDAISVAADYALGANPLGLVYLTGLGSRHVQEPLHLDSLAFAKEGGGPMPGIPVYGPVNELPGTSYYDPVRAAFSPSFDSHPLGRRYADSRTSVNTAEFTVWESQAPFAQLFSVLAPDGMMPPSTWMPRGISHRATLPEHYRD